ncbi:MAG: hypothetical protein R3C14_39280 [Caldilineaceae bacterium]
MPQTTERSATVDELLPATPVTVGDVTVQPVARLRGWWQEGEDNGGGLLRLAPASLTVQQGEQRYTLDFPDPTQATLRTFLQIGLIVSALCWLVMLLATLLTRRS